MFKQKQVWKQKIRLNVLSSITWRFLVSSFMYEVEVDRDMTDWVRIIVLLHPYWVIGRVTGNISFLLIWFPPLQLRQLFYSWFIAKNFYLWLLFLLSGVISQALTCLIHQNVLFALENVLRKWWICATRQNLIMNRNVFWPFILCYFDVLQVISCFMSYGYTTCNSLFPLWKKVKKISLRSVTLLAFWFLNQRLSKVQNCSCEGRK